MSNDWLYRFKRKIMIGVIFFLGASMGTALLLIIDIPMTPSHGTIRAIQGIILLSGVCCLLLVIPFLSRMIDRYIDELVLKNKEIGLVYSIIDNISKTIELEELKDVALDIVNDAFDSDEVDIIMPQGRNDYRVFTRMASGEKVLREKPDYDDKTADMVESWLAGTLHEQTVSPDGKVIYLPVTKRENRLALFVVRCRRPFPRRRLDLVGAMRNHIAIAFENARLYSIAITDELTGLFTVRHFRACIDRQQAEFDRYGEKFALLMIDIDDFKIVNDTHGHVTGDEVLRKVAACIAESTRNVDLGFRYGGEEFAVILPATGGKGGLYVAERIRTKVEAASVRAEGAALSVTVSIGISVCPKNAVAVKELIIAADQALYAAKRNGKNCVSRSETAAGNPSSPEPAVVSAVPKAQDAAAEGTRGGSAVTIGIGMITLAGAL